MAESVIPRLLLFDAAEYLRVATRVFPVPPAVASRLEAWEDTSRNLRRSDIQRARDLRHARRAVCAIPAPPGLEAERERLLAAFATLGLPT